MSSPFGKSFRKNRGDSSGKPSGNEDLERGHGPSVPQTPTASGYQSSPSRVYLPETQSILASMVPRTPIQSQGCFPHIVFDDQHRSAEQGSLPPSGSSRVLGYLPRILCDDSPPFVVPTGLVLPYQSPKKVSNGDCMGDSGPQHQPTLISEAAFPKTPSLRPAFDSGKYGQALWKLETHGSLKTAPFGQQQGDALSYSSISCSPVVEEDHAAGVHYSRSQPPGSRTSADPCEKSYQESGADLLSPPIQYLPSSVYQRAVCHRGESSKVVSLPDTPKMEGEQPFRVALPDTEVEDPRQVTHQALHQTQVPPKNHQALPLGSNREKIITANATPDLTSTNRSSEGTSENDITEKSVRNVVTVTQNGEEYGDLSADHGDGEREEQRLVVNPVPKSAHPAHTLIQSPIFEEMNEFLWSPPPSDDGQEAPSAPHTPILRHPLSDALHASPIVGLVSDSHSGFPWSASYCNKQNRIRSGSSSNGGVTDRPLPHIDVLIPASDIDLGSLSDLLGSSQHAPTIGSKESSSMLFRYSGIISDGASSRPMSEAELKKEVLHSLGDRGKTGLDIPNSRDLSRQADRNAVSKQIRGEHELNARSQASQAFPLDRAQILSADTGPGSSQTSSSLSTDHFAGDLSGHKHQTGNHTLPSIRGRCPTPPLLFGKYTIGEPERSNTTSKSALASPSGRFDQNPRATRLKQTDSLPTALCSLGEQDWETVSAENEARTHVFDSIAFDTKAGSSLADNSDSGNLSLSKDTPYPFHSAQARPVMQHPAHPRHNHSFMLLKNNQTGDFVQVPQYEHIFGGCLPNNNASSRLGTYQHPSPLKIEHNHPFNSSPPVIRFTKSSAMNCGNEGVVVQQSHLNPESLSSGLSEGVQEVKEVQTESPLYKTTQDMLRDPKPAMNQGQNHQMMDSKEQSHQSSTWLSTVSEVTSSKPSLLGNGVPLTRMIVWDRERHVNGTPERGVNREVGSSLADASSPGADFSSSPAPLASSLVQFSDTPPSLGQRCQKQALQQDLQFSSPHMLANFHKSLTKSINREDSATSVSNTKDRSRSSSALGPRPHRRISSLCQRRSSSESSNRLMESPCNQNALAIHLSSANGHTQQMASSGLLLRNPFLHSDKNDYRYNTSQQNIIERRGRQPKADDASFGDPTTPSSADSRPFVQNTVAHTDALPILHHPVYGGDRPWDRIMPGPLRSRPHPSPLGPPLSQRPVARAESPHLHRIPHPPTSELFERHKSISLKYLMVSMVIPPIALIYGHGCMDGIMRVHTAGEINGFRNKEKTIALCWGYGLSGICVFAVVIAIIIISASA